MPETPQEIVSSFNVLDGALLALIAISAVIGLMRGFTREILGVISWGGAVITTTYMLPLLRPLARGYIKTAILADSVSGIIIFVVALALLIPLSKMISKRVLDSALGGLDHSLGLLFGVIRGGFILVLGFLLTTFVWKDNERSYMVKSAKSFPFLTSGAKTINSILPSSFKAPTEHVQEHTKGLQKSVEAINRLKEMDQLVKTLSKPKTAQSDDSEKVQKGYREDYRSEMNRLFKTQ